MNTAGAEEDKFRRGVSGEATPYTLTRPPVSPEVVAAFHKLYSGSLPGRIKRWLLNLRGPRG
jgi:hypothetical protein